MGIYSQTQAQRHALHCSHSHLWQKATACSTWRITVAASCARHGSRQLVQPYPSNTDTASKSVHLGSISTAR